MRVHNILHQLPFPQCKIALQVIREVGPFRVWDTVGAPEYGVRLIREALRRPDARRHHGSFKHVLVWGALAFKVARNTDQLQEELEAWRALGCSPLRRHLATPFYVNTYKGDFYNVGLAVQEAIQGKACRTEEYCRRLIIDVLSGPYPDFLENHRHVSGRGPVWFDYAL